MTFLPHKRQLELGFIHVFCTMSEKFPSCCMSRVHSFPTLLFEDISTFAHLLSAGSSKFSRKFMGGRLKWSDVEGRAIYAAYKGGIFSFVVIWLFMTESDSLENCVCVCVCGQKS